MNEPLDVVVADGGSDPFSAWSEADAVYDAVPATRRLTASAAGGRWELGGEGVEAGDVVGMRSS